MIRTLTLPTTDKAMWRKLLSRAHPDTGGSHDLFIWTGSIKELVCGNEIPVEVEAPPQREPRRSSDEEPARIPYPQSADFTAITWRAVAMAEKETPPYGRLLRLLADCYPEAHLYHSQVRGASYKQLALIAHTVRMTKEGRITWYRIAEGIPLSDRHAGHIIDKLKGWAA